MQVLLLICIIAIIPLLLQTNIAIGISNAYIVRLNNNVLESSYQCLINNLTERGVIITQNYTLLFRGFAMVYPVDDDQKVEQLINLLRNDSRVASVVPVVNVEPTNNSISH